MRLQTQETQSDASGPASGNGKWEIIEARNYKGGMTTSQSGRLLKVSILQKSWASSSPSIQPAQEFTWIVSSAADSKGVYLFYLVGDPDVQEKLILRKSGDS
ncbi:hypothetical protein ACH4LK_36525 [Streptomyces lydicus]|uniref:hypothetical protein n=1 Tax=Streptomyces lydicus TaxID=47763 RepID=UPI003797A312